MAWTAPQDWADGNTIPEGQLNTHIRDNLKYLKITIGKGPAVELTINGGSVTATQAYHKIDTDGGAIDDLDTIAGVSEGDIIVLRTENAARTVILRNSTGNLVIGGDIYLDDTNKHVILICDSAGKMRLLFTMREVTFMANAFQYPAPGTDWTPDITGATLATNKATMKCWLPLNFLKIGDQIVSYRIVGDIVEVGTDICTFDCKLVSVNKVDLGTTNVAGGGIVTVETDGDFDVEATLAALETVATDNQYLLELLGSTSNDSTTEFIGVIGAEVLVRRVV